jgi:hypothetical protein
MQHTHAHLHHILLPSAAPQSYKPLLVELCLTLPAPLSALLPLLPKLMRPLVTALKCARARLMSLLPPSALC